MGEGGVRGGGEEGETRVLARAGARARATLFRRGPQRQPFGLRGPRRRGRRAGPDHVPHIRQRLQPVRGNPQGRAGRAEAAWGMGAADGCGAVSAAERLDPDKARCQVREQVGYTRFVWNSMIQERE